jgi:hypothetical protein
MLIWEDAICQLLQLLLDFRLNDLDLANIVGNQGILSNIVWIGSGINTIWWGRELLS